VDKVSAPFTDEQIKAFDEYQISGVFHEYTCLHNHDGSRMLKAERDSLVCPTCGWKQTWFAKAIIDMHT
jgi:hypothetical protein